MRDADLTAQQLHDLMSPLWARTLDLSPNGLAWTRAGYWYCGLHRIGLELATQLCESQMVRWLAGQIPDEGRTISISFDQWIGIRVDGYYTERTWTGEGGTIIRALAAACAAVLDAKAQEPA